MCDDFVEARPPVGRWPVHNDANTGGETCGRKRLGRPSQAAGVHANLNRTHDLKYPGTVLPEMLGKLKEKQKGPRRTRTVAARIWLD
jgi:hypothetical protein